MNNRTITIARRTKYSDDGHVFESPGKSLFQKSVRVYLIGSRQRLWEFRECIETWKQQIHNQRMTVSNLIRQILKLDSSGRYGFVYDRIDTLLPYRTTVRVTISK